MPELLQAPPRHLTRARQILAQYRGCADVWAARPRPLDPASLTQRGRFPLVLENLAWHYLNSPTVRQACEERKWTPQSWLRRLRSGQTPGWLEAGDTKEPCVLGQRELRRWGLIIENIFRQQRFLPASAHLGSLVEELGNLQGWASWRHAGPPKPGGILISDQAECSQYRPRRLIYLGRAECPPSLASLSQQSGLATSCIQRFWPLRAGLYLPVCKCDRVHLVRPLLALPLGEPEEEGAYSLWDTLTPGASDPTGLVLRKTILNTSVCQCGLLSWTVDDKLLQKK